MNKYIKILLILLISANYQLSAQTFPIVSTPQVLPPYSVYLSDYASPSSDKLVANLFLQDQNQSGLQVKLRITITGDNGVKLETKPEFMPPPITMLSGLPERISGTELQQYLEPANLNITGINPTQFAQSKKLPEGIYTFKIEAVEYRRNKLVSNTGMAVAWLILNDPPIWNLPHNNSTVNARNPQSIFFSWLPMHTGSPNSAFSTEYEFSLYDIIPQDRNPNEAVNTGIPIHQSTTMSSSFIYGAAETPLEVGRKYAVRLRAYDTEGRDMFKNNGYSTVLVFTYGQECITPVGINHTNITPHTADVSWTKIPGNTEFTIYYREKDDNGTNPWYEATTAQTNVTIPQLKPEHTYQYTLKALCGSIESEPADIYEFTTVQKITDTLQCGDNPNIPVIDGSPPLDELLFGDVINVGGFEGIITQAHGSNGIFTGKCIMKVTNFNILLKSHFTDLHVNQSYQVTDGYVIADRGPGIMINLDDLIPAIDSLASIPPDSIVAHIDDFTDVADSLVYDIEPAIINDSLQIVLEELLETLNTVVGDTSLTDVQQNEIQNLIDHIESLLNQNNTGTDNHTFVMFKAHPSQEYGFDEPDSIASLQQYYVPPNDVGGKEQFIRWKSITVGGLPDKVIAVLDSANASIKFYNDADVLITPEQESNDTIKVLKLTAGTPETTSIIRAEINLNDTTTKVVGMLNLISYPTKTEKLVIVRVNSNKLPGNISNSQFKSQLDKIYGVAGLTWDFQTEQSITYDYAKSDTISTFNAWPSNGRMYTPDMEGLIAELRTNGNYDENNYYIFLLNNSEVQGELGIMPFSQQYAFVFVDKFNQDQRFAKTCGHELGHGIFALEHPYKFHAGIDTFAYENLMSYHPTSTKLLKFQWDRVQNPLARGYYDSGDEGQIEDFLENNFYSFIRAIKIIRCAKQKNQQSVNIYLPLSSFTVKIGEVASALGWTTQDYPDEKINIFISNNGEVRINSYFEDIFNTNTIQYNNFKAVITGNEEILTFGSPTNSDRKQYVFNFIKQLLNPNININTVSSTEANSMTVDELQYESICIYELINDNRRTVLLTDLSNYTYLHEKVEKVAINLLKTSKDKNQVFTFLNNNYEVSYNLFNKVDTYREDFLHEILVLYNTIWGTNKPTTDVKIFLGTYNNNLFQFAEGALSEHEKNKVFLWNLEDQGGTNKYSLKCNLSPLHPVDIYYIDNGRCLSLPAMCVKDLSNNEDNQEWKDAFFSYLNGLAMGGASRILMQSNSKILKLLAAIDFSKTSIDQAMLDNSMKQSLRDDGHDWFVDNWGTFSVGVDVITLSSERIIYFANKGNRIKQVFETANEIEAANSINQITIKAKIINNEFISSFVGIVRRGNQNEIVAASQRILNHRISINKPSKGNFGYLEGSVNGNAVNNKIWSSGPADPIIEPQIFDATEVGGWVRNTDSEYKMLNELADELGGIAGNNYPNITGEIKVISERPYCISCQGVLQQFNEMFPNIKLILIDGVR